MTAGTSLDLRNAEDGDWYTLPIWLGDPPQLLNALVSTNGTTLQVPIPQSCLFRHELRNKVSILIPFTSLISTYTMSYTDSNGVEYSVDKIFDEGDLLLLADTSSKRAFKINRDILIRVRYARSAQSPCFSDG